MSSEVIVVLALVVLGIGFIMWVRMNSHEHPSGEPGTADQAERDPK